MREEKRKSLPILLVCCSVILLSASCKKYAPAKEAFFIRPNQISVKTTGNQGSGSHKITELWVYVNGMFQGAFPVENTIPIVSQGKKVTIDVFPGIKNNGLRETRIISPFFEPLKFDTLVDNRLTINRSFTFNYRAAVNFTWTENFESLGYSVIKSPKSNAGFTIVSGDLAFEGKSLKMNTSGNDYLQLESSSFFALPLGNSNVYLEINYKCNYPLTVGVIKSSGEEVETYILNPQSNWNKIYISMSNSVNEPPATTLQKVFFKMAKTGSEEAEFYLDNVKLMYL